MKSDTKPSARSKEDRRVRQTTETLHDTLVEPWSPWSHLGRKTHLAEFCATGTRKWQQGGHPPPPPPLCFLKVPTSRAVRSALCQTLGMLAVVSC